MALIARETSQGSRTYVLGYDGDDVDTKQQALDDLHEAEARLVTHALYLATHYSEAELTHMFGDAQRVRLLRDAARRCRDATARLVAFVEQE